MDIFLRLIQGSYAYLLVFQILVVSGLVLALISLIVRRTREAHALNSGEHTEASAMAPVMIPDDGKIQELETKLTVLEEENKTLRSAGSDAKTLKEKVKYLESKLLEYEILQEEIGTLSALKVENEQLKKQLVQVDKPALPKKPADPLIEPESTTAVPPMAVFFDGPTPGAPPGAESTAKETGEAAAAGLENLLSQIDSLAQPGDKDGGG